MAIRRRISEGTVKGIGRKAAPVRRGKSEKPELKRYALLKAQASIDKFIEMYPVPGTRTYSKDLCVSFVIPYHNKSFEFCGHRVVLHPMYVSTMDTKNDDIVDVTGVIAFVTDVKTGGKRSKKLTGPKKYWLNQLKLFLTAKKQ